MSSRHPKPPRIFISYAHGGVAHNGWVKQLADDLRGNEFNVVLDQDHHRPGQATAEWMMDNVEAADWIIVVATRTYVQKLNAKGNRGLSFEGPRIVHWLTERKHHDRLLVLLKDGDAKSSVPKFAAGILHIDVRKKQAKAGYDKLVETIVGPREGQKPGTVEPPPMRTGLLLVADVNDFSEQDGKDQPLIIQNIWGCVKSIKKQTKATWNHEFPLLDGICMIWEDTGRYQEVLRTAEQLQRQVESCRPKAGLRIGVHQGAYACLPGVIDGQQHFIGGGLNDAYRAACLGDAGQIIVTDFFVNGCSEHDSKLLEGKLRPPLTERHGNEVFSKRGVSGMIRFFGSNLATPKKLIVRQMASEALKLSVASIAKTFARLLKKKFNISEQHSQVRATLWVADPVERGDRRQLRATDFRYLWNGKDETSLANAGRSSTAYGLSGKGEGPPGRAYLSKGKVLIAQNLPDPVAHLEAYVRKMEAAWAVPPDVTRNFGRKARAMVCFSFLPSAPDNPRRSPMGVICIDCDDPLSKVPERDLREIAIVIQKLFSVELALASAHRL